MKKYVLVSGAWYQEIEASNLDSAREIAYEYMSYNGCSMEIRNADNELLAISRFYPVRPEKEFEDSVLCSFGDFGYYCDWDIYE